MRTGASKRVPPSTTRWPAATTFVPARLASSQVMTKCSAVWWSIAWPSPHSCASIGLPAAFLTTKCGSLCMLSIRPGKAGAAMPARPRRIGAKLQAGGARVEDDDGLAHGRSLRGFGEQDGRDRAPARRRRARRRRPRNGARRRCRRGWSGSPAPARRPPGRRSAHRP